RAQAAPEPGGDRGPLTGGLERARALSRRGLARRGLGPAAVLAATLLLDQPAQGGGCGPLPDLNAVSPRANALAEGVLRTMSLTRVKIVTTFLVALAALGLGTALWAGRAPAPAEQPSPRPVPAPAPEKKPGGQDQLPGKTAA